MPRQVKKWSYLEDTYVEPNFPACLFFSTSPRTSGVPQSRIDEEYKIQSLDTQFNKKIKKQKKDAKSRSERKKKVKGHKYVLKHEQN